MQMKLNPACSHVLLTALVFLAMALFQGASGKGQVTSGERGWPVGPNALRRQSSGAPATVWPRGHMAVAARAEDSPATPAAGKDDAAANAGESEIHKAARAGDLTLLRSQLDGGANPNARDREGHTPLMDAAAAGQLDAMRLLLLAGADVNAFSRAGRTALIEAAAEGHLDAARLLIRAGANLNHRQRGWGTALETAERTGHNDMAELLRKGGARSSGRSVGDTVCVRPWDGDGYCGTVEAVNKIHYRIRVTEIRGCKEGCPARAECSAGRAVGVAGGITVGVELTTVSWCLTDTGVKP